MSKNISTIKSTPADPLELILKGERLTVRRKTRRGAFEIAFPLPSDIRRIELRLSDMLEGKSASSFTLQTLSNLRVYATLDIVVVNGPSWWKDLASSEVCPDDALISELYRSYLRLYRKTQTALASCRSGDLATNLDGDDEDPPVGDGAFSDIANG